MLVFTIVAVAVVWISQNLFLEPIYRANRIKDIKSAADEIVESAENENFEREVHAIAKRYGMCVQIEAKSGTFKSISVDLMNDCVIHHIRPDGVYPLYRECKDSEGSIMILTEEGTSGALMLYATETEYKRDTALILINCTVAPVGATVDTMNSLLVFVSAVLVTLSLLLTFILSGVITRPIIALTKGAKALAKGDYSESFRAGGYLEAKELADTLNYAKDELQKTDRLQKELIANISHDIRTPLTMISGYSQIMKDIPGENTPENLQIIINETERLNSLVTDVLDLSKLQSGTREMERSPLDLSEITKEAMERYSMMTGVCNIAFEGYEELPILGDRSGVLQIIHNLVNNAINHTPADGMVSIRAERIGAYARLSVADTGEGIPAEALKDIWERYYKADSTVRAQSGSGLGLSIVKEIMLRHGGYYGVSSTVGKGSLFWVDFPIYSEGIHQNS